MKIVSWILELNQSNDKYKVLAWKKLGFRLLALFLVYGFIWVAVPHNSVWFFVGNATSLYTVPHFFGRFIFSWEGFLPRKVRKGFFASYYSTRLYPGSHKSEKIFGESEMVVSKGEEPKFERVFKEAVDKVAFLTKEVEDLKSSYEKIFKDQSRYIVLLRKENKDLNLQVEMLVASQAQLVPKTEKIEESPKSPRPSGRRFEPPAALDELQSKILSGKIKFV